MNIFYGDARTSACNYLSIKIWQLLHSLCMQICVGVCVGVLAINWRRGGRGRGRGRAFTQLINLALDSLSCISLANVDDDNAQWAGSGTGCSFNKCVQLPIVNFPPISLPPLPPSLSLSLSPWHTRKYLLHIDNTCAVKVI